MFYEVSQSGVNSKLRIVKETVNFFEKTKTVLIFGFDSVIILIKQKTN